MANQYVGFFLLQYKNSSLMALIRNVSSFFFQQYNIRNCLSNYSIIKTFKTEIVFFLNIKFCEN